MGLAFDSFVLTAATADLADEARAREHADAVEFRMDLVEAGPDDAIAALETYDGDLPILVTNRAAWEGGEWTGEDAARLDVLAEATRFDAVEAIDVELESIRSGDAEDVLVAAADRDVSVVASAHDFDGTPSESAMVDLLAEACEYAGVDVGKLAVTAHDRADALAVLSATHRLTTEEKTVATMAMGEAGSHTRAVAPVYGSKIGYAPVDPDEATAPGQYDLATLSRLVSELE